MEYIYTYFTLFRTSGEAEMGGWYWVLAHPLAALGNLLNQQGYAMMCYYDPIRCITLAIGSCKSDPNTYYSI